MNSNYSKWTGRKNSLETQSQAERVLDGTKPSPSHFRCFLDHIFAILEPPFLSGWDWEPQV